MWEKLDLFEGIMIAILVGLGGLLQVIYTRIDSNRKANKPTRILTLIFRGTIIVIIAVIALSILREVGAHNKKNVNSEACNIGVSSLVIAATDSNPKAILTHDPNSFIFEILIKNHGELTCTNLIDQVRLVYDSSGNIDTLGAKAPPTFNKNTIIKCSEGDYLSWPLHLEQPPPNVQEFICFSVHYSDANGEKKLQEVYKVHVEKPEKTLGIPFSSLHDSIENYLNTHNLW
jgi:hypothetical protein